MWLLPHEVKMIAAAASKEMEHVLITSAPNAKVSDGSQPRMTFDLSLSESAGSRSLGRLADHMVTILLVFVLIHLPSSFFMIKVLKPPPREAQVLPVTTSTFELLNHLTTPA
jgi:hypothetical protein